MCVNIVSTWSNDQEKAGLFIKECSEMCHTQVAKKLWGTDLINEIINYGKSIRLESRKSREFNLLVINVIRALRKSRGLKQEAIADALKMSQSNYSKLEKGLIPLTVEELNIIAYELETPVSEIVSLASRI